MKWRRLLMAVFLFASLSWGAMAGTAEACPMCSEANRSDSNRPRAYMYSILFMLFVPASVLTGFSIGFYRLSKKQQELNANCGSTAESRRKSQE